MHVLSFEQLGHGPANDEAAGNHGLSNAAERAGPSSGASKAWRFWLRAALCTTFATVLVLTVDSRQHAIDAGAEAAYRADLRRLQTLDAELDRELLRARSGLTLQYDGLTQTFQELREVQGRLAQPPARLAFSSSPTLSSALHRLEQLTRQQQSWLD